MLLLLACFLSASGGATAAIHSTLPDVLRFGESLAIQGNRYFVGSRSDTVLGVTMGAVYVFEDNGASEISQIARFFPEDGMSLDYFGASVAASPGTAVIGAPHHDSNGVQMGAVYLFQEEGATWSQTQKLTGDGPGTHDKFGDAVVLDGVQLFVGAPGDDDVGQNAGAVYVYEEAGGVWLLSQKLTPSDAPVDADFGETVDVSGEWLLVGARRKEVEGVDGAGGAYVFRRLGATWIEHSILEPDDPGLANFFGSAVAIESGRLLVGAPQDDDVGNQAGSVYAYSLQGPFWMFDEEFVASGVAATDQFGGSVSLDGGDAVIGSWFDDTVGTNAGAFYLYEHGASGWEQGQKIVVEGSSALGQSVALESGIALLGAPGSTGQVFVAELPVSGSPTEIFPIPEISMASGGAVELLLDAGLDYAGDVYLILGSFTGTDPGFTLGSVFFPLNVDPYFNYTLLSPNSAPLSASFGFLDESGLATAGFEFSAGSPPELAGINLHHAYGILDFFSLALVDASGSVACRTTP